MFSNLQLYLLHLRKIILNLVEWHKVTRHWLFLELHNMIYLKSVYFFFLLPKFIWTINFTSMVSHFFGNVGRNHTYTLIFFILTTIFSLSSFKASTTVLVNYVNDFDFNKVPRSCSLIYKVSLIFQIGIVYHKIY